MSARALFRLTVTAIVALLVGTLAVPASATSGPVDIRERLEQVPGLKVADEASAPEGYRFFHLRFTQLVDHRHPSAGTFEQRLTLLHRDTSRPMVMYTSGYAVSDSPSRTEPTRLVDGNQLSMEYRFFAPSIPKRPNWPKQLTIRQAAADQHRIIGAFNRVYHRNWLTTGASKGGMTATYHRRFFPNDVDGTVPYVAPNDVIDSVDSYGSFLRHVGDDHGCRADLKQLQRASLRRRGELERIARTAAERHGYTFHNIGSLDKSFETAVIDMYFGFWQYQDPKKECGSIPAPDASAHTIYDFYEKVGSLLSYSDQELKPFVPYYYQAAYQLGSPEAYDNYLRDLLRYPGLDQPRNFLPRSIRPKHFDYLAMPDIDFWVRTQAKRMLYVYGEYDPWSAESFHCGAHAAARGCHRYTVPGGNHGSQISQLPAPQRERAVALVRKWAGVSDQSRTRSAPAAPNRSFDADPDLREQRVRVHTPAG